MDNSQTMDRAKCDKGSTNEALFQRTIMMSLIARHRWIYNGNATKPSVLDFSVQELWSCPPMPTRAYRMGEIFLTQPKPDLAVSSTDGSSYLSTYGGVYQKPRGVSPASRIRVKPGVLESSTFSPSRPKRGCVQLTTLTENVKV